MPLLSFCIPTFNAENTIRRCLESVLVQGIADAEILLVDNASTDRTVALAEETLRGTPNVRIVRNDRNLGRICNWNRCLELSQGKYVKFALANDCFFKAAVPFMLAAAEKLENAVLVGSQAQPVAEIPPELPGLMSNPPIVTRNSVQTLQFFAANKFLTGSLMGSLYARAIIQREKLCFREDLPYCADFFFTIELARHGAASFISAPTFLFNTGVGNRYTFVGMKNPRNFFLEHRACYGRLEQLLAEQNVNDGKARLTLRRQYADYLGRGVALKVADAVAVFRGWPATMLRAAFQTWYWNLRHPRGGQG